MHRPDPAYPRSIMFHQLQGRNVRAGAGEGMKGYYDKILPTQLSKLGKKLDPNARLGTVTAGETPFPALEITPLMRQEILRGLPAYAQGGRVGFADGGPLDDYEIEAVDHDPFQG